MTPRALRALMRAHAHLDRSEDRRLLAAVRVAVNGTADQVRAFCDDRAQEGRPLSAAEARALAEQMIRDEAGGADDAGTIDQAAG
jgi:hypothetical protein